MKMPKVSVIIPCYNQGMYIEEAVNSVLAQSSTDWEIIIVNDGSTEESTNVLLSTFTTRCTTIIQTENMGLPSARNTGIKNATGEFILPLDADDIIAPTYIEKALAAFESSEQFKLVYCKGRYFGLSNKVIEVDSMPFKYENLLVYNNIFCSAVFRKVDFEKVGRYSENMQGGWEDWDLWIRLLKDGRIYQIPEELFFYRVKEQSMIQEVKQNLGLRNELEERIFANNASTYFANFGTPITAYRELMRLKEERANFEKVKKQIYHSLSYRIGHFLLSPFKMLRKHGK